MSKSGGEADRKGIKMAQRRMMSMRIVDTDKFIEMPMSARLLYYDYCMRADDDGFISSPHKIIKMIGCSEDDYKLLILKGYIIPFDDGICVIRHWWIHNYIRKDRYNETIFKEEKKQLVITDNIYTLESGIQNVIPNDIPMVDTGKVRLELGKNNKENNKKKADEELRKDNVSKKTYGTYKHVKLSDKEFESLKTDYSNYKDLIDYLDSYIEEKSYKSKSHYLSIKRWVVDAVKKKSINNTPTPTKKTFDEVFEEAVQ